MEKRTIVTDLPLSEMARVADECFTKLALNSPPEEREAIFRIRDLAVMLTTGCKTSNDQRDRTAEVIDALAAALCATVASNAKQKDFERLIPALAALFQSALERRSVITYADMREEGL